MRRPSISLILDRAATGAILLAALAVIASVARSPSRAPTDAPPIRVPEITEVTGVETAVGAALKGKPDATLVLIEFSDFQCPSCAAYARNAYVARRPLSTARCRRWICVARVG